MPIGQVTVQRFDEALLSGEDIVVLDVRAPEAVAAWSLPGGEIPVIARPLDAISADAAGVVAELGLADARVVTLCARGGASMRAAELLHEVGVDVVSVAGGITAWGLLVRTAEIAVPGWPLVIQLRREARGCLSYLVAADRDALVVDPGLNVDAVVAEADRLGLSITRVLDTHVHADHLSGARLLAEATGATPHMSAAARDRGLADADRFVLVADGDRIPVGDGTVGVVALPGHSSDMIGLRVGDALLCGDSFLADRVARPDLEFSGEAVAGAARVLHDTLHRRLAAFGDDMLVLPAHYDGGRLDGPFVARLGDLRAQPLLALDEDAFAEHVLASLGDRPAGYAEILAVNLAGTPPEEHVTLESGGNNCGIASV